jgi:surfactin synthase thioesterase subunit
VRYRLSEAATSSDAPEKHAMPSVARAVQQANRRALRIQSRRAYRAASPFVTGQSLQDLRPSLDPKRAWYERSRGTVDFHIIPGNHETFLLPLHAAVLAEKLRGCLSRLPELSNGEGVRAAA